MKVMYKGKVADIWQISRDENTQPNWVKKAFEQQYICWLDDHVRILMAGLNPSATENRKTGVIGSLVGGFAGYGMYELGYIGDYLDITNHRVVTQKTFEKEYQIIENAN